jgi:hypothetical protein
MNILNSNVRGLGKSKRRRLVKDILSTHNIDIISLQETKKEEFKNRTLKKLSINITKWLVLPSQGRSGGILLGINKGKLEILDSWILSFSISIMLKNKFKFYLDIYNSLCTYLIRVKKSFLEKNSWILGHFLMHHGLLEVISIWLGICKKENDTHIITHLVRNLILLYLLIC